MHRTYNYPIEISESRESALLELLGKCQQIYNAALEECKAFYRKFKKTRTLFDQQKQLTEIRKEDEVFGAVSADILRSALRRLHLSFGAFFRRLKSGEKPGFPRFKGRDRYDSFDFHDPKIEVTKQSKRRRTALLWIPNFGEVRIHYYRPLPGIPKKCVVRRTTRGWVASFQVDIGAAPLPSLKVEKPVGVDVGLKTFAALSDNTLIKNPRFYRKSQSELAVAQRVLSRKKKRSNNRYKAKRAVARVHERIRNKRQDFARKEASKLVKNYDAVFFEGLQIQGMAKAKLFSKSIYDAGWRLFRRCVESKAEEAGKLCIGVNPSGTSIECSACHKRVSKTLSDRVHHCSCGLILDRDINAAKNILVRGLRTVEGLAAKTAEVQNGA